MTKTIINLGIPAYLTLCTDNHTFESAAPAASSSFDDVTVKFQSAPEHLAIFLTAGPTPVRWLKLRWETAWPDKVRFLGDAWERGYGDLEWRGMSANRFMPWYFCAAGEQYILCCGVKVRPSAMCFWQTDSWHHSVPRRKMRRKRRETERTHFKSRGSCRQAHGRQHSL